MPSQDDFIRVETLARLALADPRASAYAPWLAAKGAGLKAQAKAALEAFLKRAEAWPEDGKRGFVAWLDGAREGLDDPGAVTPHPVMTRLVLPTLRTWAEAEPQAGEPHLYLGRFHDWTLDLTPPVDHFRRAFERAPDLVAARRGLVLAMIDIVERNQHHDPADYLGDRDEDVARMEEALSLAQGLPDAAEADELGRHAAVLRDRASGAITGGGLATYSFPT
ncbi:hypothetical protein [Caulobacter sp. 17J80-11]|uniref:hypothetical protein n=1 Tax=Caulobacter sp. 17J80-11 TaxID=2763502 RepID=UPI001653E004|nr:hypothetical protein [Caulobacter sp. 17J80-11]MBC6981401.1 hypothetical protein [Caulobacter sp. 17J80-11]